VPLLLLPFERLFDWQWQRRGTYEGGSGRSAEVIGLSIGCKPAQRVYW
jgi:hypothetical protein